jgi:serine protease AprX
LPDWTQKISSILLKPEFTENPEKPCRLIIEMASPFTDRIANYVEANKGKVHREMRVIPSIVVEVPYSALEPMIFSPHVRKIWHDTKVRTLLDSAVPTAGGAKAHDLGFTGKDITVAVIDTGISPHPDLIYPESRIVAWNDLLNGRSTPYDDNGHGTHVSGIIAGNGAASRGKYTGMAPEAKLVGIKALDREGSGNTSDVISALEWCIENQKTYNIKAINLSLGSTAQDSYRQDPLCRAVSAAWNSGMVVCIAAGNDGPDSRTINTPGITPNAITVGNLDDKETVDVSDDVISNSSSRGPTIDGIVKPDLVAPGTNIMSLRAGGGYRRLSGTSMAVPMVTGAVAQTIQKWPSMKPDQIKGTLLRNARNLGLDATYGGSGALNMDGLFDESKKEAMNKQNPIASILSGINSLFNNLSSKRTVAKASDEGDSSQKNSKSNNLNPLPLAMLMLLPIAFV